MDRVQPQPTARICHRRRPPPAVRRKRQALYASTLRPACVCTPPPQQVRELRLRDVERVTRCGAELLSRHARKLDGDERE